MRAVPERPVAPATTSYELQLRVASTHYNPVNGILPGTVMLLTRGKAKTRGPILTQGREREGIKTLQPLAQSQLLKLVNFDRRVCKSPSPCKPLELARSPDWLSLNRI